MTPSRYPFGKVLPEIRDLLLISPHAVAAMEQAADEFARIHREPYNQFAEQMTMRTKSMTLVDIGSWRIELSFVTGAGQLIAIAQDTAAVITGNIIRVQGIFPATLVASLPGKPLRTLIETGFAAADEYLIESAREAESNDEHYLVVTLKVRTVVLSRSPSKHKALSRKIGEGTLVRVE